jgi:starch synthase
LFSTGTLRAVPSVVSTDATTTQGGRMLPYREPGPGTDARIRLSRRFEQRVYRAATIVVAKSRWVARSLREDYGVPDDKLRVIRFGIALPPPPDIDLGAEERAELTFIGARMDRKGGRRLLDLHQRRLRDRATLNLVTRDPVPDLPGVNVFADYRPGDPRLGALLARTDLLVQPSHIDTFGYALLEAMAVGVPTVSLDVGGCAETVEDGVTGVVLPEDAPDRDLAVAIEGLLDHPERRAAMGAAGRRRVETHFDARRTTVQLADTLLEAATTERPEAKAGPC